VAAQPNGADAPGLAAPELAHQDHVDLAPLGTAAPHALVTATSDNAHLAVGAVGGQGATECLIFEQADADDKRFSALRDHLAARGFALHRLASGAYLIARWGWSREVPGLSQVGALARQMGCRP
jgi:hypothetical protein